MKRAFKILAFCAALFFAANFAWWLINYPLNFYNPENIRSVLARELPTGTSKTRVTAWLKQKGFSTFSAQGDVCGRRNNIHRDFLVTTDLQVCFSFDRRNRSRSFEIREFLTGL